MYWFAAILQLVDDGKLTLDEDLTQRFPELEAATREIFTGISNDGKAQMESRKGPITVAMMLNQTSGFGTEFGENVKTWKNKVATRGLGFVNSCKKDNLIHTPPTAQPGTTYAYGNSAEWLGLLIPHITGIELETYFQERILGPLGMTSTTFYPLENFRERTMPLRFYASDHWVELGDNLPLLTLPREKADIQYPVAGGGIFSNVGDYIKLLQHLLRLKRSIDAGDEQQLPSHALLKRETAKTLFEPSLPASAKPGLATMYNEIRKPPGDPDASPEDVDWTTAMCLYAPKDGRRNIGGLGRRPKSVMWGGAAGTEYWIDPSSGIACVFTTQMLPGNHQMVKEAKLAIEKAVYECVSLIL